MHDIFSLHFGPFVLGISCLSGLLREQLTKYFNGYLCTKTPQAILRIQTSKQVPEPDIAALRTWEPLNVCGNSFHMGPYILQGTVDADNTTLNILIHDNFFQYPTANVFQQFLYYLYYTLCEIIGTRSLILHGCGVIKNGGAFLFTGPHQSGKTTVGRTANGRILHDDQILLLLSEQCLHMDSPPFPARDDLRCRPEKPVAIDTLFLLVKDNAYSLQPADAVSAITALMNETVLPLSLLSCNPQEALAKKARLCFDIVKRLRFFKLHFDRGGLFWNNLCTDAQRFTKSGPQR